MKKSKNVQKPQHDDDHHHRVQDRLNASCHGNVGVHQPQEDAHHDQGDYNLHERHGLFLFRSCRETSRRLTHAKILNVSSGDGLAGKQSLYYLLRTDLRPYKGVSLFTSIQLPSFGVAPNARKSANHPITIANCLPSHLESGAANIKI